jgi:uncharacterized beta-barrel protein YwiB (DUF1934 family)
MKRISSFSNFTKDEIKINEELTSDNLRSDLIRVIGSGSVDAVDKFMDENNIDANYDTGMAIRLACKSGNLDLIKYFEETNGDFSLRKNLSVKVALSYGKTEAAEYILDNILSLNEDEILDVEEYLRNSEASPSEISSGLKLLSNYK